MTSRNIVGEAADNTLEDLDAAAARYAECRDTATSAERDSLRETLIRYCLPFAGRLARRYRGRGEYLEDLEACVVVDFSGVPLVDAAGVAVLVEAVRAAGEARVDLCVSGAQPYVARVLAVSGLEAVLRRC